MGRRVTRRRQGVGLFHCLGTTTPPQVCPNTFGRPPPIPPDLTLGCPFPRCTSRDSSASTNKLDRGFHPARQKSYTQLAEMGFLRFLMASKDVSRARNISHISPLFLTCPQRSRPPPAPGTARRPWCAYRTSSRGRRQVLARGGPPRPAAAVVCSFVRSKGVFGAST